MKPVPQASVLFLSYNQAEFVRDAIRSILAQEGIVLEILVSDDASRDESYQILKREIAAYQGPHTVILERNSQQVGHENVYRLALKANCDFQIQAHSDDISHPQRCLKLWQAHLDTGASVVTSYRENLDVWNRPTPAPYEGESRFHSPENIFETPHQAGCFGACLSWHREILKKFSPLALSHQNTHRDCLCAMRGALLGGTYYVAEPLIQHRKHPYQASVSIRRSHRFVETLKQQNELNWRATVLTDLEWIIENNESDAKVDRERLQAIYEHFLRRFLTLSREQLFEIGQIKKEGFLLDFIPIHRCTTFHIRFLKMIPSGKIRRLYFFPRQMKRSIKSWISKMRANSKSN
jgi:glycosyltransferase involved in cell wall biosynthesis